MKIACYNWNGVLDEVVERLRKNHTLLADYEDADVMVVWAEMEEKGWRERILKKQAEGKKVILYQQGIYGMDNIRPPFNEKIISDIVCVWGEGDKQRYIENGVPEEKIKVIGCPVFQRLKPRVPHEGKNVVFALEHWDWGDVVENNIVSAELRNLRGVNVITKGLHKENNTEMFDNPVVSDRFSSNHLDVVAEVLSTADLVVGLTESTFQLFAEYLDIPVVIPDIWKPKPRGGDDRYLQFKHYCSDAVTKVTLENLNKEILWQLKHPETKRNERLKAVKNQGGVDIKDPVSNLCQIIEKS